MNFDPSSLKSQASSLNERQSPAVSLHPVLVVLAVLVLIAYAATQAWVVRSGLPGTDYRYYVDASRSILKGKSPYEEGWWYIYPPPLAVLLIPLAACSDLVGYTIWTAVGIIAYGYAAYRSGSAGRQSQRPSGSRPTTPSTTDK